MHARNTAQSLAIAALLAGASASADIFVEFSAMSSVVAPSIVVDGITITAESGGAPANVVILNGDGLGVEGGTDDAMNYNEKLIFSYDGFCSGSTRYQTHDAADADCDGKFGESLIIPTDLTGASFAPYSVFGRAGNQNQFVTRAAEGAPVTGFEIHSKSTQIWISRLWVEKIGQVKVIDFASMADFEGSSLSVADVEIAATDATGIPGTVSVHSGYGLSVKGGTAGALPDYRVSDFESLVFSFLDLKPDAVSVLYNPIINGDHGDGNADGVYSKSRVLPIDSSTNLGYYERDLGFDAWDDLLPVSINVAVGWAPFDKFSLFTNYFHPLCPSTGNLDSFRVEKIAYCFTEEAEECYADCNGDGVLNILDFVCYQEMFNAGCP